MITLCRGILSGVLFLNCVVAAIMVSLLICPHQNFGVKLQHDVITTTLVLLRNTPIRYGR